MSHTEDSGFLRPPGSHTPSHARISCEGPSTCSQQWQTDWPPVFSHHFLHVLRCFRLLRWLPLGPRSVILGAWAPQPSSAPGAGPASLLDSVDPPSPCSTITSESLPSQEMTTAFSRVLTSFTPLPFCSSFKHTLTV